jgi:hypothetical protein
MHIDTHIFLITFLLCLETTVSNSKVLIDAPEHFSLSLSLSLLIETDEFAVRRLAILLDVHGSRLYISSHPDQARVRSIG